MDWIPITKYLDYYLKIPQRVRITYSTTTKLEITSHRKLREGFSNQFLVGSGVKLDTVEFPDLYTVQIEFDVDSYSNQKKMGALIPEIIFGVNAPGFEDTFFRLNQIWVATGVYEAPVTGNYGAPTTEDMLKDIWFWAKVTIVVIGIYSVAKLGILEKVLKQ